MPQADVEAATRTQEVLPHAGAVVGTLAYMAPEMLRGEDATAQNDVWAIGVLTYEMASGKLPFAGATALELASAILNAPAPTRSSAVPRAFQDVIERCLAKPRGERYRTAREAFRAFTELGASSPFLRQSEKHYTSLAVLPLKSSQAHRDVTDCGQIKIGVPNQQHAEPQGGNRAPKPERQGPAQHERDHGDPDGTGGKAQGDQGQGFGAAGIGELGTARRHPESDRGRHQHQKPDSFGRGKVRRPARWRSAHAMILPDYAWDLGRPLDWRWRSLTCLGHGVA